jgi:hypothetical protein
MKLNKELKLKRSEVKMYLQVFSDRRLINFPGRAYAYMIERNYDKCDSEIKHIEAFHKQQLEKRGEISKEFIKTEEELFNKYSVKDEKGVVKNDNGMFTIPDDKIEEFKEEREKLNNTFPEDSIKVKRFNEIMEEYMNEEIVINLYTIDDNELPNQITPELRRMISYCVRDKEDTYEKVDEAPIIPLKK